MQDLMPVIKKYKCLDIDEEFIIGEEKLYTGILEFPSLVVNPLLMIVWRPHQVNIDFINETNISHKTNIKAVICHHCDNRAEVGINNILICIPCTKIHYPQQSIDWRPNRFVK